MNLNKHLEFIQPTDYTKPIHIIGVGAIGSRVAEVLTRLGFDNLHIYDFDIVEDGNITNQLYTYPDLGKKKTQALEEHLKTINPSLKLTKYERYETQPLNGAVFLCVDSINTRRKIVEANMANGKIDVFLDIRMRLTDGQAYFADWQDIKSAKIFLQSMQFTDAEDQTPVSVCGTTLSVAPVILTLVSSAVMNFMAYIKESETKQVIFLDLMTFKFNAFNY
jgi:molybdopterin/thiamine biosynthesis adenylyltransferase